MKSFSDVFPTDCLAEPYTDTQTLFAFRPANVPTRWVRQSTLWLLAVIGIHSIVSAQTIQGTVSEASQTTPAPLVGATVVWAGTMQGVVTDSQGKFAIVQPAGAHKLVISFVGYQTDTVQVHPPTENLSIVLKPGQQLKEVVVEGSRAGTYLDPLNPIRVEQITSKELQKAACCNLSESFETNGSVDVSFTDAVSGTKQIQLLGLDGSYVQIQTENIPAVRGLNTLYGLNYTPGTWVSSIEVGKGAGSVVNGYESMTGQINVELQKPESSDRLFVNGYLNQMGRGELNIQVSQKIGRKWSTGLLLHGSGLGKLRMKQMDRNQDGFLDLPMYTQLNALNRWKMDGKRLKVQLGLKTLYDNRRSGQMAAYDDHYSTLHSYKIYHPELGDSVTHTHVTPVYATQTTIRRNELFSKTGLIFPNSPYRGLGLIVSGVNHDMQAVFGSTLYSGHENSLYTNLVYQTIIGTTNHTIRTGISYLWDNFREQYRDSSFTRTESVPGVFGEYTWTIPDKWVAVAGIRTDFHTLYGPMVTPRLHLKYELTAHTTIRASAGSGFRVANPIAENTAVLISARQLQVKEKIRPEKSWNYGLSITHDFRLFRRYGSVVADVYRTDFVNQLVTDLDANPQEIHFYNLRGVSFSNSAQIEINYQPIKRLDIKVAYKRHDVRTTINDQLRRRPLVSRNRGLLNVGYATRQEKWKMDATLQWIGRKRLPDTQENPADYRLPAESPSYVVLNAQLTRSFKHLDWYIGGENLTGFRQMNPILAAHDPFGRYFDASMVWGPIVGRMVYTGFRFRIK